MKLKPQINGAIIGTIIGLILLFLLIMMCSCSTTYGTLDTKSKNDTFHYRARGMNIDTIYCDGDKIHITLSK